MFGEMSLAFGVVLTFSRFFFHCGKSKGLSFVWKPQCLFSGVVHQATDTGQWGWSFFPQSSSPSSSPTLFLLSFPAQILGRCSDVLSSLLWNERLMVLQPSAVSVTSKTSFLSTRGCRKQVQSYVVLTQILRRWISNLGNAKFALLVFTRVYTCPPHNCAPKK